MSEKVKNFIVLWVLLLATLWVGRDFVREVFLSADEPRPVSARGDLAGFERTGMELFEATSPSVVYIYTESASAGESGALEKKSGAGSGFAWDSAGHVVTNFHVVEGADRIAVRAGTGDAVPATLLGSAPDYDLAVLRLQKIPPGLRPIPLGRSSDLKVGQAVFAIGNPFGLSRSLTTGIVSALNRHLPTATGREIHGVIQTDAAINPGNSGGPLLDSAGRLIGVNTAIISGSGSSAGIGFSVPVDIVNQVVPLLIKDGKYPRPGIGVLVLDEQITAGLGVVGVAVARVTPGSSAEKAGLLGANAETRRLGDVITAANGRPVRTIADLAAALAETGIGNWIELTVRRGGRERKVRLRVIDVS